MQAMDVKKFILASLRHMQRCGDIHDTVIVAELFDEFGPDQTGADMLKMNVEKFVRANLRHLRQCGDIHDARIAEELLAEIDNPEPIVPAEPLELGDPTDAGLTVVENVQNLAGEDEDLVENDPQDEE